MNEQQLDISQLGRLLNNLHQITGLKFALQDYRAHEIYTASYQTAFCRRIADTPQGYAKCVACDGALYNTLRPDSGVVQYRCHAGLIEVAIPITEGGKIVANILFGQLLDDADIDAQWESTRALCAWYADIEGLKRAFYQLRQVSEEDIRACAEIAMACVSEVRFKSLIKTGALTDYQRLTLYIDQHYAERLSLDVLSEKLSIGKTKLCALASKEGGTTPSQMIVAKRIAVARGLLAGSEKRVHEIAEAVGIPDYNYFAKVFKKLVGQTPLAYRKQHARRP